MSTRGPPAPIDCGSAPVERVEPAGPPLRIGAYVTNISDIDLLQDQFSVEMLLWTTWAGDPQADPSDQLMILNGIYDGDILAGVDPRHWMIPWNDLLEGRITKGAALCEIVELKSLCLARY